MTSATLAVIEETFIAAKTLRREMQFCRWFLHEADSRDRLLVRRTLIDRGYGVPDLPYFLAVVGEQALHDHLFNDPNRLNVMEFLFAVNIKLPRST